MEKVPAAIHPYPLIQDLWLRFSGRKGHLGEGRHGDALTTFDGIDGRNTDPEPAGDLIRLS
jgi:hypothetical protein